MSEEQWRQVTPYFATERVTRTLIAPGVCQGPVLQMLVMNITGDEQNFVKGTRLATGKLMGAPLQEGTRPSGLYDEYDYELPPRRQPPQPVNMKQVCEELKVNELQSQLTLPQRKQLLQLLCKYRMLWSTQQMPLQQTSAAEHIIDTGDSRPIAQHPRPTGPKQKQEIETRSEIC